MARDIKIGSSSVGTPEAQPTSKVVAIVVIAFILQVMLAPNISIGNISPNFILIAVLIISMMVSQRTSTIIGFLMGLLFDLLSSGPVGAMALLLALLGFLFPKLSDSMSLDSPSSWLIAVAICALGVNFAYAIIMAITGSSTAFFASIIYKVLPWTLYDIVAGLLGIPFISNGSFSGGSFSSGSFKGNTSGKFSGSASRKFNGRGRNKSSKIKL